MKKWLFVFLYVVTAYGQVFEWDSRYSTRTEINDSKVSGSYADFNGADNYLIKTFDNDVEISSVEIVVKHNGNTPLLWFSTDQYIRIIDNVVVTGSGISRTATYVNGVLTTSVAEGSWNHIIIDFNLLSIDTVSFGYDKQSLWYSNAEYKMLKLHNYKIYGNLIAEYYNNGRAWEYGTTAKLYIGDTIDYGATYTDLGQQGSETLISSLVQLSDSIVIAGSSPNGKLFRSTDYGVTYTDLGQQGSETRISSLTQLSDSIVIAGTNPSGKLFRSTDYGVTFTDLGQQGSENGIYSLTQLSDSIVIAGTNPNGKLFRSTDYGVTFTDLGQQGSETRIYSLVQLSDSIVIAGTLPSGKLFRSTDYGVTFTDLGQQGSETRIYSLVQLSDSIVIAGTFPNGKLFRSTDYGLTYTDLGQQGSETHILSLAQLSDSIVIAGTLPNGKLFRSTDYGVTYTDLGQQESEEQILSLTQLSDSIVIAGTNPNGKLLRSPQTGLVGYYNFNVFNKGKDLSEWERDFTVMGEPTELWKSLAAENTVSEIYRHFHNTEYWFGKGFTDQYAKVDSLNAWHLTTGAADTFGDTVRLFNGDEIAALNSNADKTDIHELFITDVSQSDANYLIELLYSSDGTWSTAKRITTLPFRAAVSFTESKPIELITPQIPADAVVWARALCMGQASKTISFFLGLHIYEY